MCVQFIKLWKLTESVFDIFAHVGHLPINHYYYWRHRYPTHLPNSVHCQCDRVELPTNGPNKKKKLPINKFGCISVMLMVNNTHRTSSFTLLPSNSHSHACICIQYSPMSMCVCVCAVVCVDANMRRCGQRSPTYASHKVFFFEVDGWLVTSEFIRISNSAFMRMSCVTICRMPNAYLQNI